MAEPDTRDRRRPRRQGHQQRRGRTAATVLLVIALIAGAALAGWWAARATLEPEAVDDDETTGQVVWAESSESSIGRTLPLSTILNQPATTIATNGLSGIVTAVSPGEASEGSVLFEVSGTPVRAVTGEVPFYRDLEAGISGADVDQLNAALVVLDYLDDAPDSYTEETAAAVEDWQDDLGIPETGTVPLGELVAVPSLPTTVQLGESIVLAASVGGGEEAVLAPTGEQTFALVVSQDQATSIPADARVEITWESHTWTAVIASSAQGEFDQVEFELAAANGDGPVCGDDCDSLPGDAQVVLRSEVIITPEVSGTAVPAAAVRTTSDGTTYVITQDGEVEVSVTGSGNGLAIVEGIEPGTLVQAISDDGDILPPPAPENPAPQQLGNDSDAPTDAPATDAPPDGEPGDDQPDEDVSSTDGP